MLTASTALHFVDALARVTPAYDSLHQPWSGAFHVADHGLLFGAACGVTHLVMLPLPHDRAVTGVYNVGGQGRMPGVAGLEPIWLEHLVGQVVATMERLFHRARMLRTGVVDPLTGWNSREYMRARLREEVARSQRSGVQATCLVVGVDGMQAINQTHGISAGDNVLRELSARIESQVRASDAAAHLGSDAFAILLPGTTPQQALPLAGRVLAAVRAAPVHVGAGCVAAGHGVDRYRGHRHIDRRRPQGRRKSMARRSRSRAARRQARRWRSVEHLAFLIAVADA